MKTLSKTCLPTSLDFSNALQADRINNTQKLIFVRGGVHHSIIGMVQNGAQRIIYCSDGTYPMTAADDICVMD